jgi:NAD(P)-dependent dehydrogenase (short-subunit alcohol dehydrogenase family)
VTRGADCVEVTAGGQQDRAMSGRVALVTGGSSGIGLAIARRLAAEGVLVSLLAGSDVARSVSAAAGIRGEGGTSHSFIADVSDPAAVQGAVNEVCEVFGPPSILVNAAGVWLETALDELDRGRAKRMVDVNLLGTILVTAAVAPLMIEAEFGHIVNISSSAASTPSPGYSVYAATKAAVNAFTRAAALELAPHGVAINALAPGNTATAMNEQVRVDPGQSDRLVWIERTTPSRRSFTPAEEIAEAALLLIDGRVQAFHGAVLPVDEGRTAGIMR